MNYEDVFKKLSILKKNTNYLTILSMKYKEVMLHLKKHKDMLSINHRIYFSYSIEEALEYYNQKNNTNLTLKYLNIKDDSKFKRHYRKSVKKYRKETLKLKDIRRHVSVKVGIEDYYMSYDREGVLRLLDTDMTFYDFLYQRIIANIDNQSLKKFVQNEVPTDDINKNYLQVYRHSFFKYSSNSHKHIQYEICYWLSELNVVLTFSEYLDQIESIRKKQMYNFIEDFREVFFVTPRHKKTSDLS